ncbi:MAG: dihydroxyacetone kinase subunit DhaK, partial [Candidatus Humimicrobiaceae bacterium]
MKKIINNPENVVHEMLKGLRDSRPDTIELVPEKRIVYRKDPYLNKVGIVSGSGSGHEPLSKTLWWLGMTAAIL